MRKCTYINGRAVTPLSHFDSGGRLGEVRVLRHDQIIFDRTVQFNVEHMDQKYNKRGMMMMTIMMMTVIIIIID